MGEASEVGQKFKRLNLSSQNVGESQPGNQELVKIDPIWATLFNLVELKAFKDGGFEQLFPLFLEPSVITAFSESEMAKTKNKVVYENLTIKLFRLGHRIIRKFKYFADKGTQGSLIKHSGIEKNTYLSLYKNACLADGLMVEIDKNKMAMLDPTRIAQLNSAVPCWIDGDKLFGLDAQVLYSDGQSNLLQSNVPAMKFLSVKESIESNAFMVRYISKYVNGENLGNEFVVYLLNPKSAK